MKKIQTVFTDRLDRVVNLYRDYSNNPFDSALAHGLRVGLRELRTLFQIIKPAIQTNAYSDLNKQLRESAQLFGPVRELDVFVELMSKIALEEAQLSPYYYELFHYLDIQRRKEMRRTLTKSKIQLIKETLTSVKQGIESLADHVEEQDWDEFIGQRLTKMYEKVQKNYANLDLENYEVVHDLRKDAKKVGYGATYFHKVTSIKTKKIRQTAKEIQDELGDYTDQQVNQQLLVDFRQGAEDEEVIQALKDIEQYINKY